MFDNIEARFAAFDTVLTVLGAISLFFVALMIVEALWDYVRKVRPGWYESLANVGIAVGNFLLERTIFGLIFILGIFFVEYFIPYQLPVVWWSWLIAIVVMDLSYYWMHRIEHQVRFFWMYHSVHHSSPEFNLTTSLRLAWVEGVIEWIFFIPMLLLGFSAPQTISALLIVVVYQTWIHTEKVGKLGWLDKIFNTPSTHRVHHGSNPIYLDKNYGGILIIWDRLFGTYQPETEKVNYGLTKPLGSVNPLTINFHETLNMVRDARKAGSLTEVFGHLFNRPGWSPAKK